MRQYLTLAGMIGGDLTNLCNEAALVAARVGHKNVSMGDFATVQRAWRR